MVYVTDDLLKGLRDLIAYSDDNKIIGLASALLCEIAPDEID